MVQWEAEFGARSQKVTKIKHKVIQYRQTFSAKYCLCLATISKDGGMPVFSWRAQRTGDGAADSIGRS